MTAPALVQAFSQVRHYYRVRKPGRTSYVPDWIILLLLLLSNILFFRTDPFYRQFSLSDLRISHPFATVERVPVTALLIYGAFLPLALVTIGSLIYPTKATRRSSIAGVGSQQVNKLHKLHISLLALTTSVILTVFITDIIKNSVGRPRPDLLDRCKPDLDKLQEGVQILDSIVGKGKLVDVSICTQTNKHLLQEGFRSFPSGHSSMSFAGLGFLSLWLAGQLGAARRGASLVGVVISAVPWIGALSIAISRTADYRHDVWDVTAGSIIGFIIAIYSYRRFFPPLTALGCHEPYLTRLPDELDLEVYDGRGKFQRLDSMGSVTDRQPVDESGRIGRDDLELGMGR